MALPASGYRQELVYIQCDGFSVALKGPAIHPKVGRLELHREVSSSIQISGPAYQKAVFGGNSTSEKTFDVQGPLFFEETDYELIVEGDSANKITFWHRDIKLRKAFGPVGRTGRVSSALLNFGSQVGFTELVFRSDSSDLLKVVLEIFPTKIDYRNDWEALLESVSQRLYNLAYGFLSGTFQTGALRPHAVRSLTEWYGLLEPRFYKFIQAVDYIERSPNRRIEKHQRIRPLALVRKPDKSVRKWLSTHPQRLNVDGVGKIGAIPTATGPKLPDRLPEAKARMSFDTPENRYVKWLLEDVAHQLNKIEKRYLALCSETYGRTEDTAFLENLRDQQSKVRQRLQYDFFSEVDTSRFRRSFSLVLQFSPGYRTALELGIVLQLGLEISAAIERIELKSLHELYEIWCFLELDNLIGELSVAKKAPTLFESNELFWGLIRDSVGNVKYRGKSGDDVTLQYNGSHRTPTGVQNPDNLLTLEKRGGTNPFKFILDAKYRIRADSTGIGPEVDAINAMHRYRDAFVSVPGHPKRLVSEAIVLFPWGDEKTYVNHSFYQSIKKVGVGALPFLPSAKLLVEQLLSRWLTEPATQIDDHSVGVEQHARDGTVLLGPISPRLTLEDVESIGFYHVPKKQLALENRSITHVALYEPATGEHHGLVRALYKVKDWVLLPRNEIPVDGRNPDNTELYYRIDLDVEAAERLEDPKRRTAPWGVHSHRYIPLSVFDSSDVLEVMASDPCRAKVRLRVWRFVELVKNSRDREWMLEMEGRRKGSLKVANDQLILSYQGSSEVLGNIEALPLAGAESRLCTALGLCS